MPRKPEPKFTVIYVEDTRTIEEQRKGYELYINFLVEAYKEQEALVKNQKKVN